jgi:hypothetical protein
MSCPICYTDDGDMIVCWNDHCLCETCYRECLKPRVRYDAISGVNKYHVNNTCPTCRVPMFDWFDLVIENMNNRMIQPVRPIVRQIVNIITPNGAVQPLGYWTDLQANVVQPQQAQPVTSGRRCGICRNIGHNRRTCPTA